jgi:peptidoglycan-associated lipoprotein
MSRIPQSIAIVVLIAFTGACAKRAPSTTAPVPTETPTSVKPEPTVSKQPEAVVQPPKTTQVVDKQPVPQIDDEDLSSRPLEELSALLKPAFFQLDSAELDETNRAIVTGNAEILRKNQSWMITIEGHADERGTPEYNLALGERRAQAVKAYLVSLGIATHRLSTVSYGEEFPFDPGHNDAAWAKNRRAYFQVTAK